MSYSRGALLLESEEHFPVIELKFNHQTAVLQLNDAIHSGSGMITLTVHATVFLHTFVTRIDLFLY